MCLHFVQHISIALIVHLTSHTLAAGGLLLLSPQRGLMCIHVRKTFLCVMLMTMEVMVILYIL